MRERWLVTGAAGQLGGHVLRALASDARVQEIAALVRAEGTAIAAGRPAVCDLGDLDRLAEILRTLRPSHIAHIGAVTSVAEAHADPLRAHRINVASTRRLAACAYACGARLAFSSTDMIFGGDRAPYRESDPRAPLSAYGRSKASAEAALRGMDHVVVVRLPLMYGLPATPRATTFATQMETLRRGESLKLFVDEFRTPISLHDAALAMIALARSELAGRIHVAGPERLSRFELVQRAAAGLGITTGTMEPVSRLSFPAPEPRPEDLSLVGDRFVRLFPAIAPRRCGEHRE
jgi:dTDP-4-dehydrorhamnose reductase